MKVIFVILGSLIGAGFASGQEIKLFFSNYGIYGMLGLIVSAGIITIIVSCSLKLIVKKNLNTYEKFMGTIFKNKKICEYSIRNIINLFLIASFLVMCIGFSTCLKQQFGISRFIGSVMISILCYITFVGNINRIIEINKYIIPGVIVLIVFAGIIVINNKINIEVLEIVENEETIQPYSAIFKSILNSLIYASYNLLPLIPVLVNLDEKVIKMKKLNSLSVWLFIGICLPAISMYFITNSLNETPVANGVTSEMLLLSITEKWGGLVNTIFTVVILLAIYTSAVCSGYGFAKNISKNEKQYRISILIICLASMMFSNFNFSNTVQLVYPVFGILGFLQMYYIIKSSLKCSNDGKNE